MNEIMIEFDPNKNPTENAYKKLIKKDRVIMDDFEKYCLISASPSRAKKIKSNAIRFLSMAKKDINKIDLKDLRNFLRILKQSDFSDYYKNDVKGFVQRFLKWRFEDWSKRFNAFDDIKYNSDAQRKKKIKPEDILTNKDVSKLIKQEPSIFWKCFIVCQYQCSLRTLEVRSLKWDMLDTEDPEVYFLTIKSKKNKNGAEKERISPPLSSEYIYFLNELKKEQEENKIKSPYVFPSKTSPNIYISSGTVAKWFNRLTKRVLGKPVKNYLLRHSFGEHLHQLVRKKQLSKENAVLMMGHSEKMFDKTYSHTDKAEFKKLLKKQVLSVDYIAPEKKHKLELEIEELKKNSISKEDVFKIVQQALKKTARQVKS